MISEDRRSQTYYMRLSGNDRVALEELSHEMGVSPSAGVKRILLGAIAERVAYVMRRDSGMDDPALVDPET